MENNTSSSNEMSEKEYRRSIIEGFVSAVRKQQEGLSEAPGQNVLRDQEADERTINLKNLTIDIVKMIPAMDRDELDNLIIALRMTIAESGRAIEKETVDCLGYIFTAIGRQQKELLLEGPNFDEVDGKNSNYNVIDCNKKMAKILFYFNNKFMIVHDKFEDSLPESSSILQNISPHNLKGKVGLEDFIKNFKAKKLP